MKLYLKNAKTGKKYEIVGVDRAKNLVTLRGTHAEFTETFDKDRFKRLGYTLEKEQGHAVE
jgi:hypothetical protein